VASGAVPTPSKATAFRAWATDAEERAAKTFIQALGASLLTGQIGNVTTLTGTHAVIAAGLAAGLSVFTSIVSRYLGANKASASLVAAATTVATGPDAAAIEARVAAMVASELAQRQQVPSGASAVRPPPLQTAPRVPSTRPADSCSHPADCRVPTPHGMACLLCATELLGPDDTGIVRVFKAEPPLDAPTKVAPPRATPWDQDTGTVEVFRPEPEPEPCRHPAGAEILQSDGQVLCGVCGAEVRAATPENDTWPPKPASFLPPCAHPYGMVAVSESGATWCTLCEAILIPAPIAEPVEVAPIIEAPAPAPAQRSAHDRLTDRVARDTARGWQDN
jgi:hypothetical protein